MVLAAFSIFRPEIGIMCEKVSPWQWITDGLYIGEGKNAVEGTGDSFSFYDLGEPRGGNTGLRRM